MKGELIAALVIAIFVAMFAIVSSTTGGEWAGADDQAEDVIAHITGGTYQPWAEPIWEPPSGEIESLLFALQAALGAIVIGYFLGYYRGRQKSSE